MNPVTGLNAVLFPALATLLVSCLRAFLLPGSILTLIARLRAHLVSLAAPVKAASRLAATASAHAAATHSTSGLNHRSG
ncbi:MAG: hypothetical protein CVU33_13315 [Betaproteobacteria bacterium HGW-Betaproteobacteria-6]|nr:MAG: hypothetical protein CVU33_13315 [Betaproteobacteria bacterium HGW-Betaproteobacteria-6]